MTTAELMELDDLIDLLDGEATIITHTDGSFSYCFNHSIFLDDMCLECGESIKD